MQTDRRIWFIAGRAPSGNSNSPPSFPLVLNLYTQSHCRCHCLPHRLKQWFLLLAWQMPLTTSDSSFSFPSHCRGARVTRAHDLVLLLSVFSRFKLRFPHVHFSHWTLVLALDAFLTKKSWYWNTWQGHTDLNCRIFMNVHLWTPRLYHTPMPVSYFQSFLNEYHQPVNESCLPQHLYFLYPVSYNAVPGPEAAAIPWNFYKY